MLQLEIYKDDYVLLTPFQSYIGSLKAALRVM